MAWIVFIFEGYSSHQDLNVLTHSFPTRRSSDLLDGARPMSRVIQEKVKQPLAEELLFGKLAQGGEVHVSIKEDALNFELTPAAPKLTKAKSRKEIGRAHV